MDPLDLEFDGGVPRLELELIAEPGGFVLGVPWDPGVFERGGGVWKTRVVGGLFGPPLGSGVPEPLGLPGVCDSGVLLVFWERPIVKVTKV